MPWWFFCCVAVMSVFVIVFSAAPVFPEEKAGNPVFKKNRDAGALVNKWFNEGTAAGNVGDWYDNRDRGHSSLYMNQYHQLKKVGYTIQELKERFDWGTANRVLFRITVGNSSTSANPRTAGSNARCYYVNPFGVRFLYLQYTNSNLFVYPEHRDYDPGHGQGGYGDLYPLNTPYCIISQGSSGSDRSFLRSCVYTLAAFRPEVKTYLDRTRLLIPTVQMIFRSSNKQVKSEQDYLTAKAHPTVFSGRDIDAVKMVTKAHDMTLDVLPPMVQIKVTDEKLPEQGVHYFDPGDSEKLIDTPCAVGRVFRGYSRTRTISVDASHSYDLNGKPLTYHWKLLQGDRKKATITTKDNGRQADITVAYHPRFKINGDSRMETNRVDIGVFVHNGMYYSAPAFISFFFLDNELRTYGPDGKIVDIYYDAGDTTIGYPGPVYTSLVGNRYDIYDWDALFDAVLSIEETCASKLLKKQFTPGQKEIIKKAAEAFKACTLKRKKLEQDPVHNEYDAARKKENKQKKALAEARSRNKTDKSEKMETAFKNAQSEYEKAAEETKALGNKISEIRKKQRELSKKAAGILTEKRGDKGGSVKQYCEGALNSIKNDINLYISHASDIDKLAEACTDEKRKKRFAELKSSVIKTGILVRAGDNRYVLHSVRSGNAPLAKRLTRYELYRIRLFNLGIMNSLLFPEFLNSEETKNLVDFRITTVKPWRDVYTYDAEGNLTGWRRHIDGKATEYTQEGLIVLKKGADGKVLKTKKAEYVLETPNKKKPWQRKIVINPKKSKEKK